MGSEFFSAMMISLLVIIIGVVLMAIIIKKWPRSGKMGINLKTVYCPQCGAKAPAMRKPANLRQALWGGWTCSQCGCEFDKYGNEISR